MTKIIHKLNSEVTVEIALGGNFTCETLVSAISAWVDLCGFPDDEFMEHILDYYSLPTKHLR